MNWHHSLLKIVVFINLTVLIGQVFTEIFALRNSLKIFVGRVLFNQWVSSVLFLPFYRICLAPYSSNRLHKRRGVKHVKVEVNALIIFSALKSYLTARVLVFRQ